MTRRQRGFEPQRMREGGVCEGWVRRGGGAVGGRPKEVSQDSPGSVLCMGRPAGHIFIILDIILLAPPPPPS